MSVLIIKLKRVKLGGTNKEIQSSVKKNSSSTVV